MKKPIKLSINNPCSEDWNKMTKNSEGRFCALCQKNVVDFTSMSDEEIKNYFLKQKNRVPKIKKRKHRQPPAQPPH